MSEYAAPICKKTSLDILKDIDLTDYCRICKCPGTGDNAVKLRPLFKGRRLTRIIANTIHIELKDFPGLPRFICEKCLDLLKTFSIFQVDFRRSEEDFQMALEARKHFQMDALTAFSNKIEMEKQKENDEENAALITNILKKAKKTGTAKMKRDKLVK